MMTKKVIRVIRVTLVEKGLCYGGNINTLHRVVKQPIYTYIYIHIYIYQFRFVLFSTPPSSSPSIIIRGLSQGHYRVIREGYLCFLRSSS